VKKYIIITVVIIIITIIGLIYRQSYISISGIKVPKNDLKGVMIYTTDGRYMVTNSKIVFELSNEISKMEKYKIIDTLNFPPSKEGYSKFLKVVIQTKQGNIGGSFWDYGNIVLDSNGYYWFTTNALFDLMDKSLKDAKKLN
jgi:uncharacterized membrane protein